MALTLKQARAEAARRRLPHRVVKVERHDTLCLFTSDEQARALGVPAHDCTCGSARPAGYTLVLGK